MRTVSALALLAIIVTGCTSSSAKPVHTEAAAPLVVRWGVVGAGDVPTLDPAIASDPTSITAASLIYGGLVRLDANLRVKPDAAEAWTTSDHGTVYTFRLRKGLRYADGRAVRPADFVDAIDRALGPAGTEGPASFYLGAIARDRAGKPRVAVVPPRSIQIVVSHTSGHFLTQLAFPSSYVPESRIITRYGETWTEHAAGFGPYSVQTWQHGRSLTLQRNPYYFGGKPVASRLILHLYTQERSALVDYRAGKLDLVSGLQPGQSLPSQLPGTQRVPALALDYLAFNVDRFPFRHTNARRAFAAAVGPGAVSVMGTAAFPSSQFLPPALGIGVPRWKPAKSARAYLARAHYDRKHPFPRITLAVLRDPQLAVLAKKLQAAWHSALGLTIGVRQLNPSTYAAVLSNHAFDLAIVRWGADYPDPEDFLGTQLGKSPANVTGWAGPKYVADVRLADSYDSRDPRRIALFARAATIAARKVPVLPLDEPAMTALVRPGLSAIRITPLGTVDGDWTQIRHQQTAD